MREFTLLISNYFAYSLAICALAAMQASLWMHIFGFTPAPFLWLTILNYWALNRKFPESLLICYVSSYALVTMSGIPLTMAFLVLLSTLGVIYLLRDRVLWSGPNSFMLSCGISALTLPISTFIWSHIVESRPVADFHFFDLLIRALLTATSALPLYYLFTWIDKVTQRTPPTENESGVL